MRSVAVSIGPVDGVEKPETEAITMRLIAMALWVAEGDRQLGPTGTECRPADSPQAPSLGSRTQALPARCPQTRHGRFSSRRRQRASEASMSSRRAARTSSGPPRRLVGRARARRAPRGARRVLALASPRRALAAAVRRSARARPTADAARREERRDDASRARRRAGRGCRWRAT